MTFFGPTVPMRKTKRQVSLPHETVAILDSCDVVNIALCDHDRTCPYVFPVNFATHFDEDTGRLRILFHCAREGRKVDLMMREPRVGFCASCDHEIRYTNDVQTTSYYRSVIGEGTISFIEDPEEKTFALELLMRRYRPESPDRSADSTSIPYTQALLAGVRVGMMDVTSICGKINR